MRYIVAGFITPTRLSLNQELYAINNEDIQQIGCSLRVIHKFVFGSMDDFKIEFVCSLSIDDAGYPMPYIKLLYVNSEKDKLKKLITMILKETDLDVDEPMLDKIKSNSRRFNKYLEDKNGITIESAA